MGRGRPRRGCRAFEGYLRPRDGLARFSGRRLFARSSRGLHRWLFGADQFFARFGRRRFSLRASLRDTSRPAGAGRFAYFEVEFTDAPGVKQVVWLFTMALGYSRFFGAGSVQPEARDSPALSYRRVRGARRGSEEILYDRMKTVVLGNDEALARSTTRRSSPSPITTVTSHGPASPTGPRPRAKSSDLIVMSARTSSSPAAFAIRRSEHSVRRLAGRGRQSAPARHHQACHPTRSGSRGDPGESWPRRSPRRSSWHCRQSPTVPQSPSSVGSAETA